MIIFNKTRKLSPNELEELRELARIAVTERFKANQIKGNTALVYDGKRMVRYQEDVAKLCENVKQARLKQVLGGLGYPQGTSLSINLLTGKVTIVKKDEPAIAQEAVKQS